MSIILLSIPTSILAATSVQTGGNEERASGGWGTNVELYPRLKIVDGSLKCVGAKAVGTFFGFRYRCMKVTIRWDAYDIHGNHYTGSFSGHTICSTGSWMITRWVEIPDFDHGEFWGYAYVDGVLKDTDHESYTKNTMS